MRSKLVLAIALAGTALTPVEGGGFNARPVGNQPAANNAEAMARAKRDYALGNIGLALEGFRAAARMDPNDVRALNGIAACYDRMGRFDVSRTYYERALALAPEDKKTLHNFRLSLTMQGKTGEALALGARPAPAPAPAPVRAAEASPPQVIAPVAPAPVPAAPAVQQPQAQAVQPQPRRPEEPKAIARATGSQSITLPIEPPPPPPVQPAAPTAPHLERISLGEIALVSKRDTGQAKESPRRVAAATAAKPVPAKPAPLGEAVLVKQTAQSSEWVFADPASRSQQPAKVQVINLAALKPAEPPAAEPAAAPAPAAEAAPAATDATPPEAKPEAAPAPPETPPPPAPSQRRIVVAPPARDPNPEPVPQGPAKITVAAPGPRPALPLTPPARPREVAVAIEPPRVQDSGELLLSTPVAAAPKTMPAAPKVSPILAPPKPVVLAAAPIPPRIAEPSPPPPPATLEPPPVPVTLSIPRGETPREAPIARPAPAVPQVPLPVPAVPTVTAPVAPLAPPPVIEIVALETPAAPPPIVSPQPVVQPSKSEWPLPKAAAPAERPALPEAPSAPIVPPEPVTVAAVPEAPRAPAMPEPITVTAASARPPEPVTVAAAPANPLTPPVVTVAAPAQPTPAVVPAPEAPAVEPQEAPPALSVAAPVIQTVAMTETVPALALAEPVQPQVVIAPEPKREALLSGPPTSQLHRVLALQGVPVPAAATRIVALIDRSPQPVAATPTTGATHVTALIARTAPPLTAPTRYARVEVLNGVGRQGLAARYGSYLKSSGWSAPRIADALHRHERSLILYTPEGKDRAMRLARRLPFAPRLVAKPAGSHVVLVLGSDSLAFDNRLRNKSRS